MLKKTETKETIVFFVTFLSLVAFQLGGAGPPWLRLCLAISNLEGTFQSSGQQTPVGICNWLN